jgi:hypothetical protein
MHSSVRRSNDVRELYEQRELFEDRQIIRQVCSQLVETEQCVADYSTLDSASSLAQQCLQSC